MMIFFRSFKNENKGVSFFHKRQKSPTGKKIKGSNTNLQEKKIKSIHMWKILTINERY